MAIPVSCNRDCGAGCPLLAHTEDGRVVKITNNPLRGPHMTGCSFGFETPRMVYSPHRLKQPLVRTGDRGSGTFREVSWEEALTLVADRLSEITSRHGNDAILALGGSGSCRGALHNTSTLMKRFLQCFGGFTATHGGYSSAAVTYVRPYLFGSANVGIDAATLQFSKLIILWGANIVDTRFGSDLEGWIREQKRKGTPVLVVDPRRSRTVDRLASEWIPVLPGTDTALMLAVLHVLLTENLVDRPFIARYSTGFPELEQYIMGAGSEPAKTPEWAEPICGTPADQIRTFALRYGKARPAALIPGLSIQRTVGGEEAARMTVALQVATGNVGVRGGSTGGNAWGGLPRPRCGRVPIPSAPSNPSVPVYRWPDAVLEGRNGGFPTDIKAIYNTGGNYLSQGSDVHKNMEAFRKVEFAVCQDLFLTPTARFCDVVLPATTFLERDDIVFPSTNHLFFSNKAIDPLYGSRHDYDIFCDLADRLGFLSTFSENRTAEEWLEHLTADSEIEDVEAFKRTGIHNGGDHLRVGLADFVADPEAHPLTTPSGRIELASEAYARTGFPAIPTCRVLSPSEQYPLRLVTPHPRYRVHSQSFNVAGFTEKEPQTLWINSEDAAAREIRGGDTVVVSSPQGRMRIPARVTEEIMPGVVCLLEGGWPSLDADGVDTAGAANVLTCTEPTMPSEGSRTHSVLVQVNPGSTSPGRLGR